MTKLLSRAEPVPATDAPSSILWSAICGAPRQGKTTLAKTLAKKLNRGIISSDFFLTFDREVRPLALSRFILGCPGRGLVVEGCEVTRLLPRLKELKLPPPDRVVFLGSTCLEDHRPEYHSLIKMQLRQIREAQDAGVLRGEGSPDSGPRVIFLPQINPAQLELEVDIEY